MKLWNQKHDLFCRLAIKETNFVTNCNSSFIVIFQSRRRHCKYDWLESVWIWLAASTQSRKYDWLRLDKIWLAAAAWWRRLRGLPIGLSTIHSLELSLLGLFATWIFRSQERLNEGFISSSWTWHDYPYAGSFTWSTLYLDFYCSGAWNTDAVMAGCCSCCHQWLTHKYVIHCFNHWAIIIIIHLFAINRQTEYNTK